MLLEVLDRTSYLELWVQYNCLIIIMESKLLIYVTFMYYVSYITHHLHVVSMA